MLTVLTAELLYGGQEDAHIALGNALDIVLKKSAIS